MPPANRGPASFVLGSDSTNETATIQAVDGILVGTTGDLNDTIALRMKGVVRFNEPIPPGYAWEIRILLGAYSYAFTYGATAFEKSHFPGEFDLPDMAINTTALFASPYTLAFSLRLEVDSKNPGPAGVDVDVILPSVYFDQITAPETITPPLFIANRFPAPGQTNVPNDLESITYQVVNTSGTAFSISQFAWVNDVQVLSGFSGINGWTAIVDLSAGPANDDMDVTLTPPAGFFELGSEETVKVRVLHLPIFPPDGVDETWTFTAADFVAPAVRSADMIDKKILRVAFTDDVRLDATANGALNPANYCTSRLSLPAVTLDVVGVSEVFGQPNVVDVEFNWEASIGANYVIIVENVHDDSGNLISETGQELAFIGYVPPRPRGRRFELLDFIPNMNIAEDRTTAQGADPNNPGTGDLRKLVLILQEVVDLLLCQIDRWTDIIDIDAAPEAFIDAILQDLGNPFADCIADLDETGKRRLARVLISIYKEKGTDVGIINAVRFFLGIEVTLDIINTHQFWQLDISKLDADTVLAPAVGSSLWYSFFIVSEVILTDEQTRRILCIADYMKGVQEHVLGVVEPGDVVTPSEFWLLNQSLLGDNTNLA